MTDMSAPPAPQATPRWALAIHGGAGSMRRDGLTPEQDAEARAGLERALDAGVAVLESGGSAMDAVEAAVIALENDPTFNAGHGAVYTFEGSHSLDAAIMDGATRAAGAVAGSGTTRNPVTLARAVMEHSPHVLLAGEGADIFSREQGLEQVPNEYFGTPERKR